MEFWDDSIKEIKENEDDYYCIEKLPLRVSFRIMERFAEELTNATLQRRLLEALSNRKPFREFKYIIDDSGIYRDQWFAFKDSRNESYVKAELEAFMNPIQEEDDLN